MSGICNWYFEYGRTGACGLVTKKMCFVWANTHTCWHAQQPRKHAGAIQACPRLGAPGTSQSNVHPRHNVLEPHPTSPKRPPRWTHDGPTAFQGGTKTAQRGARAGLRRRQPSQKPPETAQEATRCPQQAPRGPREAPKRPFRKQKDINPTSPLG